MRITMETKGGDVIDKIFDLELSQKEGELATALITLQDSDVHVGGEQVSIKYGRSTLFRGKMSSVPIRRGKRLSQVRLIADNVCDTHQLLEKFKRSTMYYAPLDSTNETLQAITEAIPARFYFDMKGEENAILSNIEPNQTKYREIDESSYWSDSFAVRSLKDPISLVNISIEAQWIQRCHGMTDLFPRIAKRFTNNAVNSLNNLERQWWRLSKSLPRSCYSVVHSHIQPMRPVNGKVFESFKTADRNVRIKRFWFNGVLDLRWNYEQKIKESASFSIKASTTAVNNEKSLIFRLGEIDIDDSCGSFFATDKGIEALEHAASRAFNHIISSHRDMEICICGDIDRLRDITVNDSIKLKNKQFKDGYILGKVISTKMKCSDQSRFMEIKIAAYSQPISSPNFHEFFVENVPKDACNMTLTADDVVEEITVNNIPEYQIEYVKAVSPPTVQALKREIMSIPTSIKIRLKNLNTVPCINKQVDIGECVCKGSTIR